MTTWILPNENKYDNYYLEAILFKMHIMPKTFSQNSASTQNEPRKSVESTAIEIDLRI